MSGFSGGKPLTRARKRNPVRCGYWLHLQNAFLHCLSMPYWFGNIKSSPPASNVTHRSTGGIQRIRGEYALCFVSSSREHANDAVMTKAATDCQIAESASRSISFLTCQARDQLKPSSTSGAAKDYQIERTVNGLKKS